MALTIQQTFDVFDQAEQILASKGYVQPGGPRDQLISYMEKNADAIAHESGGTLTGAKIKEATQNVKDTSKESGFDVNRGYEFMRIMQQNELLSKSSVGELNSSGTTKSLADLGRFDQNDLGALLQKVFGNLADMRTAAQSEMRGLPVASAQGRNSSYARNEQTYAPGTFGSAGQKVGGMAENNGGWGQIIKNVAIDVGATAGAAKLADALGGGNNAQNNARILGAVFGGDMIKGALNGQSPLQVLANKDITQTVSEVAGAYLTTRNHRNEGSLELLGRTILGREGGRIGNNVVESVLGNIMGGRGGIDVREARTPGFFPERGNLGRQFERADSEHGVVNMRFANTRALEMRHDLLAAGNDPREVAAVMGGIRQGLGEMSMR